MKFFFVFGAMIYHSVLSWRKQAKNRSTYLPNHHTKISIIQVPGPLNQIAFHIPSLYLFIYRFPTRLQKHYGKATVVVLLSCSAVVAILSVARAASCPSHTTDCVNPVVAIWPISTPWPRPVSPYLTLLFDSSLQSHYEEITLTVTSDSPAGAKPPDPGYLQPIGDVPGEYDLYLFEVTKTRLNRTMANPSPIQSALSILELINPSLFSDGSGLDLADHGISGTRD